MWPWGHLAVGYLLYSLGLRQQGRRPAASAVFLVAFGTLLPDLLDKPLAWTYGVLDSGRSLGHSMIIAVVVIGLLYVVLAPRIGRSNITAFAVGYLSHPVADLPFRDLLAGDLEFTTFLVWPLLPSPDYGTKPSIIGHFLAFEPGPRAAFEFLLFGLAAVLWYLDGAPGLDYLRRRFGRTRGPSSASEKR
jgi:hypothetical protein